MKGCSQQHAAKIVSVFVTPDSGEAWMTQSILEGPFQELDSHNDVREEIGLLVPSRQLGRCG